MPLSHLIDNKDWKVHCLEWRSQRGDDAPAFVLLHPSSFCADIWGPAAEIMSREVRCISMDLRGHGRSSNPVEPFSWDDLAGDLVALLDGFDLKDCLVVGHSRGGGVSLLGCYERQDRVKALMVIEPNLIDRKNPGAHERSRMLADRARNRRGVYPDRQSIYERYRERPVLAPWSEESLWAYINGGFHDRDDGQVELACPPEVEALYYLIETPDDVWERMAGLNMPVTLVAAEQSDRFRVENPTTQEFLNTVPGVKLKTIPGGHFVVQEDPARIAELVLDYARQTGVL